MKIFQLVLLTICAIGAYARPEEDEAPPPPPEGGDHAKWQEKHKKHMECLFETKNLTACCPMPKLEEIKNDPECKSHLEGIETMEDKKKQHRAIICFNDCIYKNKGLIDNNNVKWDKIKEYLEENADEEFVEVVGQAVEFCEEKVTALINTMFEARSQPIILIQPIYILYPINITRLHNPNNQLHHQPLLNHNQNFTQNYHLLLNQGKEAKEKFKNQKFGHHMPHHQQKDGEKRCGMIPSMISSCIRGYIVRSCPESKWTGTDECNELKSKAKTMEECTSH